MYPYRTTFSISRHQRPVLPARGDLVELVERLIEIKLDALDLAPPHPPTRLNLPVSREFETKVREEQARWSEHFGMPISASMIVRNLLQKDLDSRP